MKLAQMFLVLILAVLPANAVLVECFGDSLTQSAGLSGDTPPAWPARVDVPGISLSVSNKAVGGTRIANVVAKIATDVIPDNPDLCIVWIGTNDLALDNTTLAELKNRYTAMITALNASATYRRKVWYCTMAPRDYGPTNESTRNSFNTWLKGLEGVTVVDCDALLRDPGDTNSILPAYTIDGTHLSDSGKDVIVAEMEARLTADYVETCAMSPWPLVAGFMVVVGVFRKRVASR